MASWQEFTGAAPELSKTVQARLDVPGHKLMATLRKDGSPRISGIETSVRNGELLLGMMWQSRKALDLQRDPRVALHSAMDPDAPRGEKPDYVPNYVIDVKLAGRAVEITDEEALQRFAEDTPPGPFHLFRFDLSEAVVIRLGDPADHLVIDSWHEGVGVRSVKRK
jgi:hypothetical protein